MSQKTVEQVLGRMLLDREFRQLMASDQARALAEYDLTEDERTGFKNMDLTDFHQTVMGLDERISKGRNLNN
jgi:hypothetical protein